MPKRIRLETMHERHPALTPPISGAFEEAASVCLSRHHTPPVEISMSDNEDEANAELAWVEPDSRVEDAWANSIDTTEWGGYGCVIAGVELMRGLFAVRRAETGTGADYYLGPAGSGRDDLEGCVRLEVSGVAEGNHADVAKRLLAKVRQARNGASSLPALAGVVGFRAKLLMVKDVTEGP